MNGEFMPPPTVADVLIAGEASGWPAIRDQGEIVIDEGEAAWRAAMTPTLAEAVWATWHDEDDADGGDA